MTVRELEPDDLTYVRPSDKKLVRLFPDIGHSNVLGGAVLATGRWDLVESQLVDPEMLAAFMEVQQRMAA
jgi:hypothetical protein